VIGNMFSNTIVSYKLLSQNLLWREFKRTEWKFRHHLGWQMDICVPVFQRSKYKSNEHQLFDSICIAVPSSDAAIECKFLLSLFRWEEWADTKNCADCDCNTFHTSLEVYSFLKLILNKKIFLGKKK